MSDTAALSAASPVEATSFDVKARLCLMMFLQYFVQGCYLPVASIYVKDALGFSSAQIGAFGSALAVGPLFAPFILGQLVDRLFATERVLAVCHAGGGVLMLLLAAQSAFWPVVVLGTLYSIVYVPSLMLTNSLAFHHLKNRDREFPLIRLWGTIGFIVPAWFVEFYWLRGLTGDPLNQARGIVFVLAGLGGLVMAAFSLLLPHTPPRRDPQARFAPSQTIALLVRRHLLVLVLVTLVISMAHKFFFVWNGPFLTTVLRSSGIEGAWEQTISSLGQVSEVAVMVLLALSLARLGFKWTMVLGSLAYVARCLVFAAATSSGVPPLAALTLAVAGQTLHGFCFGFFLAAAFMYVDRATPADLRGSAQNLFGTTIVGLGMVIGGLVAGYVGQSFTTGLGADAVRNWPGIWLSGAALALVGSLLLAALMVPRNPDDSLSPTSARDSAA